MRQFKYMKTWFSYGMGFSNLFLSWIVHQSWLDSNPQCSAPEASALYIRPHDEACVKTISKLHVLAEIKFMKTRFSYGILALATLFYLKLYTDHGGTWTHNVPLRRRAPCPLGHMIKHLLFESSNSIRNKSIAPEANTVPIRPHDQVCEYKVHKIIW